MDSSTLPAKPRFNALINRDFALLWSGQAISIMGDWIFEVTLLLWIAAHLATGQSWAPLAVSGVLLAALLPMTVISPIAGVFVDRCNKRALMLWMDGLRAGLILALIPLTGLIGPLHPSLPVKLTLIYAVVILSATCGQFFIPSRLALIRDVVGDDQLTRASSLAQVTMPIAAILGPPCAGPLLFSAGAAWALGLNAASFGLSFFCVLLVRAPASTRYVERDAKNFWREFRSGLSLFVEKPVLRVILVTGFIIMAGGGAINTLDVFFAIHNLHASPSAYGWLSAAMGSGALMGAIFAGMMAERIGLVRVFWITSIVLGALLALYSRMDTLAAGMVVLFLLGIPMAALNVVVMPLSMRATPRDMIGRVQSVLNQAVSVSTAGSMLVSGWLASTVLRNLHLHIGLVNFGPIDAILGVAGLLGVLGGVYAWAGTRKLYGDRTQAVACEVESELAKVSV